MILDSPSREGKRLPPTFFFFGNAEGDGAREELDESLRSLERLS